MTRAPEPPTRRSPARALLAFFGPLIGAALALAAVRDARTDIPAVVEPTFAGEPYLETGDLPALRARGYLRILVEPSSQEYLPRDVDPLFQLRELARGFGAELGVEAVLVPVAGFSELIPALLAGRGDLVSSNLTVTEERKSRVAFALPLATAREQVVGRGDAAPASLAELAGRTLAVQEGTTFWETSLRLSEQVPELRVEPLPPALGRDQILDGIADGSLDLTIEDSNVLDVELDYRPELRAPLDVSEDRAVAWAVRPDNPQLLGALNAYLVRRRLVREQSLVYREDLSGLRARRRLRMLTRNNAASYFLWRGELRGFEYELVRAFARRKRLRLEVVVADSHDELIPMLLEGRGDLIAAFLTPTEQRRALGVAFSRPYHYAAQRVVAAAGESGIAGVEDLAGRTVVVRRSSAYWERVEALRERGIGVELEPAPESFDVDSIVDRVASGEYDLTVVDSHLLELELTHRDDVAGVLDLGEPEPHGWAVREEARELLAAIDAFWAEEYRSPLYNVLYRRYFRSPERIADWKRETAEPAAGRFTEWDEAVKRHAQEAGFDWRLIMALMYQESRFDPEAVSWAGARGLLQVMPRTAREMGFGNIDDPEDGIRAGILYLARLRERFAPELYAEDRIWFTIAAYNTGPGHVLDAQRVARQQGWNPHRWFGHVERGMRLLSKPEFARLARHGYLTGRVPVAYVRLIRDRYGAYIHLTEQWGRAAPTAG